MPTLTEIITRQAEYVRRSDIAVEVDRRLPSVSIRDESNPEGLFVFLQGDDAEEFIARAERFYSDGDVSWQTAVDAAAYDFADIL